MLAENLRLMVFSMALSEIYRKCGLSLATKSGTPVPVFEKEFCTNILGLDFHLVFNSCPTKNGESEIVVCDICFDTPSREFIDIFAQKVETISTFSESKIIGLVVSLSDIPASLLNFTKELSIYTLTYQDNPVLQSILKSTDELCYQLYDSELFLDDIMRLKHQILGVFQGYASAKILRLKPYFTDVSLIPISNIYRTIQSYKMSCFATTTNDYLLHVFSGDTLNLKDSCKIITKIKGDYRYKEIKFQGIAGGLLFSMPTTMQPRHLLGREKQLKLKVFNGFSTKTFTLQVE